MSATVIYLYLKTHNKTGLKYLGKTIKKDPYRYKGSGVRWLSHVKKHGYDVETEILYQSESIEQFRFVALYYSRIWDIVESVEFANLINEDGGQHGVFGLKHSEASKQKMSESAKKRPKVTEETRNKMRISGLNRAPISEETRNLNAEVARKENLSEETRRLRSNSLKGNKNAAGAIRSGYTRSKMSEAARSRPKLKCPHCGKVGAANQMKRYHMDNCKHISTD